MLGNGRKGAACLHKRRSDAEVAIFAHALHRGIARDQALGMANDGRARPEISSEVEVRARLDIAREGLNQLRAGPGEPENRLRGIAHSKDTRTALRVDELEYLDLQVGSVLKLIDEKAREPRRNGLGYHLVVTNQAICLVDDVAEVDEAQLGAAAPEVRRRAAHRLVRESETDEMAVGVQAEGGKGFEIARSQIEEIHLLGGVAGNRLELGPVLSVPAKPGTSHAKGRRTCVRQKEWIVQMT